MNPDDPEFVYDEFSFFDENLHEYDIERDEPPSVRRVEHRADGQLLSALQWGSGSPEYVFLHGGAQNAHTWDTVLLQLDRPALAIDLPGHGHSSHRDDAGYHPRANAVAVAAMIDAVVGGPIVLIGMSLGGLTATSLAASRPDLVRSLIIVDITPGVNSDKASDIHAFIAGPQTFPSFTEIFDRTVEFNPTRSASSLRRGILHNAHRLADGSWQWNYDRRSMADVDVPPMGELWDDVSAVRAPYLLVRGGSSPVVDDDDVAELRSRQPDVDVVVVPGAGHSVQGDDPLRLAELILDRS